MVVAAGVMSVGGAIVVVEEEVNRDEADGLVEVPRPPQSFAVVNYHVSYSLIPCSSPREKLENSVSRLDIR